MLPRGDCSNDVIDVTVLLTGMVLRDLKRLVNNGADGVFHLIGCNIEKNQVEISEC